MMMLGETIVGVIRGVAASNATLGFSPVAVGVAQPTLSTVVALGSCLAVLAVDAVYGAFVYYRR
jgi:hypothetical protein